MDYSNPPIAKSLKKVRSQSSATALRNKAIQRGLRKPRRKDRGQGKMRQSKPAPFQGRNPSVSTCNAARLGTSNLARFEA